MKTNNTRSNRTLKNLPYFFVLFITLQTICADESKRLLKRRPATTQLGQTATTAKKGDTLGAPFRLMVTDALLKKGQRMPQEEQAKQVSATAKKVTEDKDDDEVCIYI